MTGSVREEVMAVLSEQFGIAPKDVSLESKLREDLDLDSIDLCDMIGVIEKKTGLSVDLADFIKAQTLGDFVGTLESLMSKSSAA